VLSRGELCASLISQTASVDDFFRDVRLDAFGVPLVALNQIRDARPSPQSRYTYSRALPGYGLRPAM